MARWAVLEERVTGRAPQFMEILGIDIGGSGIKGAPVDVETGQFLAERHRIPTPQPARPEDVTDIVADVARFFGWKGLIGCTFPAIIKNGVAYSASNVDEEWIGCDGQALISRKTHCPTLLINDADAAGIAEMQFGAGRDHHQDAVVLVLTIGTGIGSAIFVNGSLFPNTELGHLILNGKIAEHRASDRVRKDEDLSWKKWAKRLNAYLERVEFLFSPDVIIIGGGVSNKYDRFFPYLGAHARLMPAQLRNDAGIIGAAYAARGLA